MGRSPKASVKRPLIAGVGASAGGLEAFTQLLQHVPADTGIAFVLVQHLDPDRPSALTELLAKATTLPLREATDGLQVEADHVYVIPPGGTLTIADGVLKLQPRRKDGAHRSIDIFFESLAQDQRECAIGVVLSGTASDGTLGLEAIKAEGGITFAQDDSAKYDSMPHSAIAAGCVDFVLKPEDIANELDRIAKHPFVARPPEASFDASEDDSPEHDRASATDHQDDDTALPSGGHGAPRTGARQARAEGEAPGKAGDNGYRKVLLLLRNHSGVDFSLYKSSTIQRRITRRMVLSKHHTAEDYAAFLRGNAKELDALYSDVLISVTSFFRNPDAFDVLKRKVFPKLLHQRGDDPFRVWVLGCSTGQEAYSIAMAFVEAAEKAPRMHKLQVFATDLNDALLDKARHGLYAKSLAQDISPERLRRFFVEEEGGYRISKPLRETVVFARQNLIGDPPFSRMDLVSCRNLMIYLEPSLQKKLLPTFHYALKSNGFLFLGASESIGGFTDLFEPLDRKNKIYSKKVAPAQALHLPVRRKRGERLPPMQVRPAGAANQREQRELQGVYAELNSQHEADRVTVNKYAPPSVLVNAELQVLQFRGPTGAYLEPPTGKASFDVLKMAREGLMLPLRAAINRAKKENKAARKENVRVRQNGETRAVNVEVIPLKNLRERCFLILFDDVEKAGRDGVATAKRKPTNGAARPARRAGNKEESRRAASLERDLAETRDYVQAIQEQYEAANEELQAANEEVQSANEELQSINEELETSKEELESANEELTTVNEEMANRNAELNRLNSDLTNLQTSTQLAILLLGRDLTVRRFSPRAEKPFNLLAADVGRPIGNIRHNLDLSDLETLVGDVIDKVREDEREVRDREGRWYALRVRPYLTLDNKVDGAVLVLVDIDALKRAEAVLAEANAQNEAIVRTVPDPLVILHGDLRVQSANDAFYRIFKLSAAETEGRSIFELDRGAWRIPRLRQFLEDIVPRNSFFNDFEVAHDFPRIGRRTMLLNARALLGQGGKAKLVLLGIRDITDRELAEEARNRLAAIVEFSEDAIVGKDLNSIITSWNRGAERLFGYTAQEAVGQSITMLIPPDRADEESVIMERIRQGEPVQHYETVRCRKDGTLLDISLAVSPIRRGGRIVGAAKIARDITERKQAAEALKRRAAEFEALLNKAPLGIYVVDADFRIRQVNPTALPVFGDSPGLIGRDFDEVIHILWPKPYADEIVQRFRHTLETGEFFSVSERIEQRRDRETTEYYEWQINRIMLPEGRPGVVCYFRDIAERVMARQRQLLLTNELAHRGKNLLAVVQSIASRSLSGKRSLDEARQVLTQRIQALSRSHSVLLNEGFEGAPVAEIVRLEFEAFSERVDAVGPGVMLNSKTAQTFALLVHELATNAAKHGALSHPNGRIEMTWSIEGAGAEARFRFRWQEREGPAVTPPTHQGFGRILIEKVIAQDFEAKPKLRFAPEGFSYEIDAPLSVLVATGGLVAPN